MDYSIRQMTIEDYDEVYGLWDQTAGLSLEEGDTREAITLYLNRNQGLCFVAVAENQIIGTVLCGHEGQGVIPDNIRPCHVPIDQVGVLQLLEITVASISMRQRVVRHDRTHASEIPLGFRFNQLIPLDKKLGNEHGHKQADYAYNVQKLKECITPDMSATYAHSSKLQANTVLI